MSKAGQDALKEAISALEQPQEIKARIAALKEDLKLLIEHDRSAIASATATMLSESIAPKVTNSEPDGEKKARAKMEPKGERGPTVASLVLGYLVPGKMVTSGVIAAAIGKDGRQVSFTLQALKKSGRVISDGRTWARNFSAGAESAADAPQDLSVQYGDAESDAA
jgi:hypothetical protein